VCVYAAEIATSRLERMDAWLAQPPGTDQHEAANSRPGIDVFTPRLDSRIGFMIITT
jgi:hypothetical protein